MLVVTSHRAHRDENRQQARGYLGVTSGDYADDTPDGLGDPAAILSLSRDTTSPVTNRTAAIRTAQDDAPCEPSRTLSLRCELSDFLDQHIIRRTVTGVFSDVGVADAPIFADKKRRRLGYPAMFRGV